MNKSERSIGKEYCIDVSGDGRNVWVNGDDGSCIGRFGKKFGLDVHKSSVDQLAGGSQCLHCTQACRACCLDGF